MYFWRVCLEPQDYLTVHWLHMLLSQLPVVTLSTVVWIGVWLLIFFTCIVIIWCRLLNSYKNQYLHFVLVVVVGHCDQVVADGHCVQAVAVGYGGQFYVLHNISESVEHVLGILIWLSCAICQWPSLRQHFWKISIWLSNTIMSFYLIRHDCSIIIWIVIFSIIKSLPCKGAHVCTFDGEMCDQ